MAKPQADVLRLDQQLCFPLYAASNLITRLYRPLLAEIGLTYPQYLVMLVLWESAPQSVGALGERLHLDSGTLTPLLKRMEAAGLVDRKRDSGDERRVLIALTPKGADLREAALTIPGRLAACIPAPPTRQKEDVRATLLELLAALSDAEPRQE